jgi:hypothetical protein
MVIIVQLLACNQHAPGHDVGGGGGHLETSIPEAVADAVKVQGDPEEHQLYRRDSECDIAP